MSWTDSAIADMREQRKREQMSRNLPEIPADLDSQASTLHLKEDTCYKKAKETGQKTFTLIAQDRTAPKTICQWIASNIGNASDDKLREALEAALTMRRYPHRRKAD